MFVQLKFQFLHVVERSGRRREADVFVRDLDSMPASTRVGRDDDTDVFRLRNEP